MNDKKILEVWKKAWFESDGKNPLSKAIDRKMMENGVSILDVHTRIGVIAAIKSKDRTEDETRLFDFWLRTKLVAENALVDQCAETTQGAMFLLKARYGYKDGMDVNISKGEKENKVLRTWGEVASGDAKAEEQSAEG